jgi:hypothetical protein
MFFFIFKKKQHESTFVRELFHVKFAQIIHTWMSSRITDVIKNVTLAIL